MTPQKAQLRLPIDGLLEEIKSVISGGKDLILKASPGSGKTTRVPPALLNAVHGQIWVLEPRRLAARMSAMRVASELGETPGQTVGWQMRFDRQLSDQTRVLFLTEGMFAARLAQDPLLRDVSCVILDEFHERHQQTDVAFALCRHLQQTTRPDLRMIIMSATLEEASIKEKLPQAKVLSLDLPLFPVEVRHWSGDYSEGLIERTVKATQQLSADPKHSGHILVFLPGTSEIVRVRASLERQLAADRWLILELRGSLDKSTQDLAFAETDRRKVILATNIAESSITIPGVTGVVDAGLARVPAFNFFTGISTLETKPVSKASIIQRGGRAGRTGPGINLRLFSLHDEASRPEAETPEICRLDLSQVYLSMLCLAEKTKSDWLPDHLPWLTSPESKQWLDAKKLLSLLGLIDDSQRVLRPEAALLPVHPRLARFAFACTESDLGGEAPWLTAILANPDDVPLPPGDSSHLGCDLLAQYESLRSRPAAFANVTRSAQQLSRLLGQHKLKPIQECSAPHDLDLTKPLLRAFPDRVMLVRDRKPNSKWIDATICGGGDLQLAAESSAAHGDWVIALDASSQRTSGSAANSTTLATGLTRVTVTKASKIKTADLRDSPPGLLRTEDAAEWDASAGKSRLIRTTRYGVLTVSSQVLHEHDNDSDSDTSASHTQTATDGHLAKNMLRQWPKPFENSDFFDAYLIRQKLAFDGGMIDHCWDGKELRELLIAHICDDAKSFDDVRRHSLEEWLRFCVGEDEFTLLQRVAPTSMTVGAGYKVPIQYSESSPPWIEARLQNFFGQAETPKILSGKLPLTIHLLAPNMRALQVTTDLASFWRGVYPSLKNEYKRKYPRHYWPDDPMSAEPPPMRPPRKR